MHRDEQPAKSGLVRADTFAALVSEFMRSPKWTTAEDKGGYAPATKDTWGRELLFAARADLLGKVSVNELRPSLVQAFFDGFTDRPAKQAVARSAMKKLEAWARTRDKLPRDIMTGVEISKRTGGHEPWTDAQVLLAETHAAKHIAKLITLAVNTGQRGSDLVRMGPTDLEAVNGQIGINVRQQKTGKVLWIPFTSALVDAMKDWKRRPGPFLRDAQDQPWRRKQVTSAWDYERGKNPQLVPVKDMVLHGLRATACVRLRRASATIQQIADMVGMSEKMVANYCRFADQKVNATAALFHLERAATDRKALIL